MRQAALRTEIWDGQSQEVGRLEHGPLSEHEVLAGVEKKCVRGREFEWSGDNLGFWERRQEV